MSYEELLEDMSKLLIQFRENLIEIFPSLILAIIIFLIGFLIARVFQALMNRFVKNLDRIIPNKQFQKKIKQLRLERYARLVSKIFYWIIIIFFLTAATEVMGLPIITTWLSGLVQYLPNILVAVVIIFTGIIGGGLLRDIITTASTKAGLIYSTILGKAVQYSILFIAILIAIDQVGIDIAIISNLINIILAAILFGAALAFGLGARTSISNILASYYLQNMYREGHSVKIGEIEGQIIQITATAVILETKEGQISVPAKEFSENVSVLLKKE